MNRSDAETVLIRRLGTLFSAVGLNGTAIGNNPDLNDCLYNALTYLGYLVADVTNIADSEIQAVETDDQPAFLILAEIRGLETAVNAAEALVDISVGARRESLGQIASRLQTMLDAKRKGFSEQFGYLFGKSLEAGTIDLDTAEDGTNVY